MRPILGHLGPATIYSHALFVSLGVLVALAISWRGLKREEHPRAEFLWIIAGGLVGAAVFARYGLVLRYLHDAQTPTLSGFLRYGGRTLLGGLAGAYLGVVIAKRLLGYRRHVGDALAPGVAFGIAVGRIGCFLAEKPGTPTHFPWGVALSSETTRSIPGCESCPSGVPLHPSFLYESGYLVLVGVALIALRRRSPPLPWIADGDLFKLFLLAYGAFRFAVEFVRGNPEMLFGLTGSQLVLIPAIIVLGTYFVRQWRAHVATDAVI